MKPRQKRKKRRAPRSLRNRKRPLYLAPLCFKNGEWIGTEYSDEVVRLSDGSELIRRGGKWALRRAER